VHQCFMRLTMQGLSLGSPQAPCWRTRGRREATSPQGRQGESRKPSSQEPSLPGGAFREAAFLPAAEWHPRELLPRRSFPLIDRKPTRRAPGSQTERCRPPDSGATHPAPHRPRIARAVISIQLPSPIRIRADIRAIAACPRHLPAAAVNPRTNAPDLPARMRVLKQHRANPTRANILGRAPNVMAGAPNTASGQANVRARRRPRLQRRKHVQTIATPASTAKRLFIHAAFRLASGSTVLASKSFLRVTAGTHTEAFP
jgi:hypothetical protein